MFKFLTLPSTTKRVKMHTKWKVNQTIENKMKSRVEDYKRANWDQLLERFIELNKEWDTERVLETNAAVLILIGAILSYTININWLILVGLVGFFLLQHALQGWCPPLPIIRRLGVRTSQEINEEIEIIERLMDKSRV